MKRSYMLFKLSLILAFPHTRLHKRNFNTTGFNVWRNAPNFKYKPFYDIMEYDRTPPSKYNGPHKRLRGAFGGYGTHFCSKNDKDICVNNPDACLDESLSSIPNKECCHCNSGKPYTEYYSGSSDSTTSNSSDIQHGNRISNRSHKSDNRTYNSSYSPQDDIDRVPIQTEDQTEVHRDPVTDDIKIRHTSSRIERKD